MNIYPCQPAHDDPVIERFSTTKGVEGKYGFTMIVIANTVVQRTLNRIKEKLNKNFLEWQKMRKIDGRIGNKVGFPRYIKVKINHPIC